MAGVYCYDGSFRGLLTLLAQVVPRAILPTAIGVEAPPQQELFATVTVVATDDQVVERFWRELTARLPPVSRQRVHLAFLANAPGRELLICRYLLLAWQQGPRAGEMLAHPDVAPLWKLARQVSREAHRYLGFVRFREVTGHCYYAEISPDHRILSLIAPHFVARFGDQRWLLHDLRHGEAIIHDPERRQWLILPLVRHAEPAPTALEERFQELWQRYFATLAIGERKNLRLQQSKVPLKVRPWLVEFSPPP
jgi:probable DNA metabolism protein